MHRRTKGIGIVEGLSYEALSALAGLAGGAALGMAARRARFCTLGSIESALYGDDWTGARMWAVALGCAILGSFALAALGAFDPARTFYMQIAWNPAASIAGGLIFGYGMALAGNCGFGALARLGGGDLRAFVVVIVMGISAAMAIGGPTAELRVLLFPPLPVDPDAPMQGVAHALGRAANLPPMVFAVLIGGGLLAAALASPTFRASRGLVFWAAVVGLAVASGWGLTGPLAADSFDQVPTVSHSFADPLGDTILWLMTSSGGGLGFGVGGLRGPVRTGAPDPGRFSDGVRRGDGARLFGRARIVGVLPAQLRRPGDLGGDRGGRGAGPAPADPRVPRGLSAWRNRARHHKTMQRTEQFTN